ncbi:MULTISPECIES: hypothetical protein [Bacteria]|uniref:hypothetical protein n=1 Tax=Bacteria TaxID=2 RepID=UPI003C7BDF60
MDERQSWTLIGVFAAAVLGGMALVTAQFNRVIRAELSGTRGEMHGMLGEVHTRIDAVDMRLARMEDKADDLDREMTNLAVRIWRSP